MTSARKIPETLEERHEDVQYAFAFKKNNWDDYHFHRPAYPVSMWEMWLDFHRRHGAGMDVAHDIGAGPGTAAKVLADYFTHIYASDAGMNNITSAQSYLKPVRKFTFHCSPAEKPWLAPRSVDFACICMALHYMDSDTVFRNIAATLRPGGTLAVCTYSFMLKFPGAEKLQNLYFQTLSHEVHKFVDEGKLFPAAIKGMCAAMAGLNSAAVPAALYENVTRLQVNVTPDEAEPFCFVEQDDTLKLPESRVMETEEVRYLQDKSWRRKTDIAWLKGFLTSSQLGFNEDTWRLAQWKELERVVDEEMDGNLLVEWPVAMILATRKMEV